MAVRTYDPNSIYVICGAGPIVGFADGSSVKVTRVNDTFEPVDGIGGVVSRRRNSNTRGVVELTLAQTSVSNDFLSLLAIADEKLGRGVFPIAIGAVTSKSLYVSAFAWIRKPSDAEYGKDLTNRIWIFDLESVEMFTGGVFSN
jgi:hypothetical protein